MTVRDAIQLLNDIERAISNEDYGATRRLLRELTTEYTELNATEKGRVKRFSVARFDENIATDNREKLTEYIQAAIQTELRRSEGLIKIQEFAAGTDVQKPTVLDTVVSLRDAEKTLQSEFETASEVDLPKVPPALLISNLIITKDPFPKGDTADIECTVVNVGDETVENIDVMFDVPKGISVESSTVRIEQLADEQTVSTTLTGTNEGEYEIEVTAESDTNDAFAGTVLEVLNKLSAVERAFPVFSSIEERLTNIDISNPDERSLEKKITNAERATDRAKGFTEQEQADEANEQLTTAINIIGAFLNEIDAIRNQPNSGLEGRDAAFLRTRAEELIDRLSLARDASI